MAFPFVRRKKYEEALLRFSALLCHATGGRLSYPTYPAAVMESAVDDYIQECCDRAVEEYKRERELHE